MRSTSPRENWKYVNSLNKHTKPPDVDVNEFYNFFKSLNDDNTYNNINNNDNGENVTSDYSNIDIDNTLNDSISTSEITNLSRNSSQEKRLDLI